MDNSFWQAIVDADFALPDGHALSDLTAELLDFLASTDPALRDGFGYLILAYWIGRGVYSPEELRTMAAQLVQGLASRLGEQETDSVFRRSFSALVLSRVVSRDNKAPFFTEPEVKNLLRWTLEYLVSERDSRGYVPDKGWAHACAHTADLLRALAQSRYVTAADLESLLLAIADKMMVQTPTIFVHDENERLAAAVQAALNRGLLTPEFLTRWIERLQEIQALKEKNEDFDPAIFGAYKNSKSLLWAVYFYAALAEPPMSDFCAELLQVIKAF